MPARSRSRAPSPPRPAAPARNQPSSGRSVWLWFTGVALLAVVVHWNALGNALVFDDLPIIRDNPRIRSLSGVPALYGEDYWGVWGEQRLYRPFVLTTYALNYAVGELDPKGYIAVNVALHAVASVLVLGLARSLGAPLAVAGAAGLLFAVHPVHTEAVTGIVGRAELLAAVFVLAALLLHRRAQAVARPWPWRAGAAAAYLLALLSKENAITLLGLAVLGDARFPVRRGRTMGERWRSDYLLLAIVTALGLAIRGAVVGFSAPPATPLNNPIIPRQLPTALGNLYGATFAEAKLTAIAVLGTYARLLLWPGHLSCDYSLAALPLVRSLGELRFWAGLAALLGVGGGCRWGWRRAPLVAYGLGFLAVSFALSSNLVVRIGTICAERLLYLPSVGFVIAVAAGLGYLMRRRVALAAVGALVLALAVSAGRTWTRNRDWHDEAALWGSAVQVVPRSAKAQTEYGRVLLEASEGARARGHNDSAESLRHRAGRHLDEALRIYPESRPAANHLTQVALIDGDLRRAAELCQRTVGLDSTDAMAWSNWGLVLMQEGERIVAGDSLKQADARQSFEDALGKLNRAVAIDSTLVNARLNRGALYRYRLGRPDLALVDFRAVLRWSSENPRTKALRREVARMMEARDERIKD